MKGLILGYKRHGKDTVGELIAEMLNLSFTSSSEFCAETVVYPHLSHKYASWQEAFKNRGDDREVWYNKIKEYNTPDKSRLVKEILKDNDLYVGMRNIEEYEASKHLFDWIMWVDASWRGKPAEDKSSCTVFYKPEEMIWINNSGTQYETKVLIEELLSYNQWWV